MPAKPTWRVATPARSAEQLEGLRQRSLDIALVGEPPAADDPDLMALQVLDDPMLLVLGNRLMHSRPTQSR